MRIRVIDHIDNNWVLGKTSLLDYLESMNDDSFSYTIQRGIVQNKYLDSILEAVENVSPLPPISLIAEGEIDASKGELEILSFNILDGLQRSYRLWIYLQFSKIAEMYPNINYRDASAILREAEPNFSKAVAPRQIRGLFDTESAINVRTLKQHYGDYPIYVYLWFNLPEKEAVKKMLILNAGQKKMPIHNQYELMYMHIFDHLALIEDDIELIRIKDERVNSIKKGNRLIGQYVIPTVVIGLQSFIEGKPVRLSEDMLYEANIEYSDDYINEKSIELFFDDQFIKEFVKNLNMLDKKLCTNDDIALKWLSKDTVISGILGGFGKYIRGYYRDDSSFASEANQMLYSLITERLKQGIFHLDEYEQQYAMLSSVRINIGMIVRKAISEYTYKLIQNGEIEWMSAFSLAQMK